MKKALLFLMIFFNFVFVACDDGRIYEENMVIPEEGRVVKLTGEITGAGNWSAGYTVAVAGFKEDDDYAIITKAVSTAGCKEVILSGINEQVTQIELCVVNRLRKRVLSMATFDCPVMADTIRLEVGTIDIGMYATIQRQLFNTTCANCHGASTQAAAGLFLTEGRSYEALVGQPSQKLPEMLLVEPKNVDKSVLYQTLSSDISKDWNYDHTKEVLSEDWLDLLEDWIDDGAKE